MKHTLAILLILLAAAVQARGQSPAYILFSTHTDLDVAYVTRVPLDTLGYIDVTHIKAHDCEAWRRLTEELNVPNASERCDSAGAPFGFILVSKENPSVRVTAKNTIADMLILDPSQRTADVFHVTTIEQIKTILSNHIEKTYEWLSKLDNDTNR